MAKINRVNGNVQAFASAAVGTERTVFGEVTQSNDLTAQFSADFLRGWGIVGPSDQPTLEDFNGAMYTHGQLLAYLHQMGVPEYNAAQEYYIGSIVTFGSDVYRSRADANVGNTPSTSTANWRSLTSASLAGATRNLKCSIAATSASATFTADSVIVASTLAGTRYNIPSLNKIINLATVGAGGMDVGLAPVNGFVGIYAIYNPVTDASALLAVDATAAAAPEIYSGANMPAGYTASALISVWRTSAARIFVTGLQRDRSVSFTSVQVLNSTSTAGVSTFVTTEMPKNAVAISGNMSVTSTTSSMVSMAIYDSDAQIGGQPCSGYVSAGSNGVASSFADIKIITSQTVRWAGTNIGVPTFSIFISSYKF